MDELLQKLLEAEVLSADTKSQLEEAFKGKVEEAVEVAKAEATADVRAELTEQWITERDTLIEAIDSKVDTYLTDEMSELKEDIDRFRDLEAESAEKLVEAKAQMADELKGDLGELVEKIDKFLEIRLNAEIEELREDIDSVRKDDFGRKIFEAVAEEYKLNYANDEETEATLRETEERLTDTAEALEEAERKLSSMERSQKLEEVLSPLAGRSKEVMEAILKNVPTGQLDDGYKTFIGRVLKETTADDSASEKEDKVLAEGVADGEEVIDESNIVTGDNDDLLEENKKENEGHGLSEAMLKQLKNLGGVKIS